MLNRWLSRAVLALCPCTLLIAACSEPDPLTPSPSPSPACRKRDTSSPGLIPKPPEFTVVQVDPNTSAPLQLALQACAGLHNRKTAGSVYIEAGSLDPVWLADLGLTPTATVSASDFLSSCVEQFPACVRYDYTVQQTLLPNILTVAAALDAVPLDASLQVPCGNVAFDAIEELKDKNTPALATKYVFDNYATQTTGLAMLNPGYEVQTDDVTNPPMTGDMKPALVDFVFSQKLFVVFLVNGCTDGNPEKELLSSIVNAGHWPTPLGVYGYNNSWLVGGGYIHEAQTRCLDSRNMGAIPSETGNLSFFSTRTAAIEESDVVTQNELEPLSYDPGTTYVAFVVGDGDNIQFIMSTRHDWIVQRVADCQVPNAACPSLTWTISPHLAQVAPDVLVWYYEQARKSGHDYFALPPSGHLYAYPSSLAEDSQDRFVAATEVDACVLGITGTVHWDWIGTWNDAEDHFLPKYARAGGPIRGVFPVNVPYPFPTFTWWPEDRFFAVLGGADGGKLALFRPRQWRGINNDADKHFLSPQKMVDEISNYPKGTVTWVYMTSDGGLTLENSFLAVAKLLPPHVKLVSTDTAAKLAIAAGQK